MQCPNCKSDQTRIMDSRPFEENASIRRRRKCDVCGTRFSTAERVEVFPNGPRPKKDIPPSPQSIPAPEVHPVVINEVIQEFYPEPEPEPEPMIAKPGQAHTSPTFVINGLTKRQMVNDLVERYRDARRCARGF